MSRVPSFALKSVVVAVVVAVISVKVSTWTQAADDPKSDSQVKSLQEQRLTVLQACYEQATKAYDRGELSYDKVHAAHLDLLNGKLDLCDTNAERIKVLEESVKINENLLTTVQKLFAAKEATRLEVLRAEVGLLDSRINREKSKAAK